MDAAQTEKKPEAPKPKNLAQKILEIQKSVGVVKKRGYNKEHGYKFLQIEDAVLAVNKLLSANGLLLTPTLQNRPDGTLYWENVSHTGGKGYIAKVIFEWTLEDVETGVSRHFDIPGEGYDTTDKGTAKAITASRKQAIIVIFQLAVGFDNEAQGPQADHSDRVSAAKAVADKKIAEAAAKGNATAIDALSQIEPEHKIIIGRPQDYNGHYVKVSGFIAPPIQKYFDDTSAKPFPAKGGVGSYWRLPEEYEKGLVVLCQRLNIEVEG